MPDPLKIERRGRVLEVTLDRPKANAIDAATSIRMGEVFSDFRDDDGLWVAILTGAGSRIFSAGWDLKAAAGGEHERMDYGPGGFGGITELWDLHKPVIAAVNGIAVGGGCELMLAADLVVASEAAEFWFPEARLGNMADAGGGAAPAPKAPVQRRHGNADDRPPHVCRGSKHLGTCELGRATRAGARQSPRSRRRTGSQRAPIALGDQGSRAGNRRGVRSRRLQGSPRQAVCDL